MFNIHYFNSKYQQEVYSKSYVISRDVGILSDIKRKFGKDGKIEAKKTSKMMEIVDYEDILVYLSYMTLNHTRNFKKFGLDFNITNTK